MFPCLLYVGHHACIATHKDTKDVIMTYKELGYAFRQLTQEPSTDVAIVNNGARKLQKKRNKQAKKDQKFEQNKIQKIVRDNKRIKENKTNF